MAGGRKISENWLEPAKSTTQIYFKQHLASILGMCLDFKMIFISWRYFAGSTGLAFFLGPSQVSRLKK